MNISKFIQLFSNQKGYTLIELLIVQVFIGLTLSFVGSYLSQQTSKLTQLEPRKSLPEFEKLEKIYLSQDSKTIH